MVNDLIKNGYLLDTNFLIGFSLWKPISLKLNVFFWTELSNLLKKNRWILLDVVVGEIKYPPNLSNWCKEQKNKGLVRNINDDNRTRAIEINNQYPMIEQYTYKSEADTYLIAYAEANSLVIFSRESPRRNNLALYKIPDVGNILNIKISNKPKIFLKGIGFV